MLEELVEEIQRYTEKCTDKTSFTPVCKEKRNSPLIYSIKCARVGPDPRSAVPVPVGSAERHGLHQPRGQPSGPHCYWRRHQRRYRETAGLTALVKTYSTY